MSNGNKDASRRSFMAFAGLAAMVAPALASSAAEAATKVRRAAKSRYAAQEKVAEDVVTKLIRAAQKQDPDLIGSLMAEKVIFKPTPEAVDIIGRANVVAELHKFMGNPVMEQLVMAEGPGRMITMGGETGTAVLVWREDFVKGKDGSLTSLPIAAAVFVVGDKVQSWYDWPLGADPTGNNWGAVTH